MIKGVIQNSAGPSLVLLGLTPENIRLLQQGKPLFVDGRDLMVNVNIAVIAGEDQADVHKQFQELLNQTGPHVKTENFTCCEKHAKEFGVPHRPRPGYTCPPDARDLTGS